MTFEDWWDSPDSWKPCDGTRNISRRAFQAGAASRDVEVAEWRIKHEIACSTLGKAKVDRSVAMKALAAQCEETRKLHEQVALLREALQREKEYQVKNYGSSQDPWIDEAITATEPKK